MPKKRKTKDVCISMQCSALSLVGYHGTSLQLSNSIQTDGFQLSKSGWFGSGVYFFQDFGTLSGSDEAHDWAKYVKHFRDPAVLSAEICSSRFVDLVRVVEDRQLFEKVCQLARDRYREAKGTLEGFKESSIYDIIRKRSPDLEVIRAFTNGSSISTLQTVSRPQVQICVIKSDIIVNVRLIGGH